MVYVNSKENLYVEKLKEVIIPKNKKPINILVTRDDMIGKDISKMTNFMGNFINEGNIFSSLDIYNTELSELLCSKSDLMHDVACCLVKNSGEDYGLVPDLDSLPEDVRNKLYKNEYHIADSKQVCGNMRSVIVNKKGVRVKDITLKKAEKRLLEKDVIESIYNRIQLKQIYGKLIEIEEIQLYQLDNDRNHRIISQFLSARDYVLYAQEAGTEEDTNKNLNKAAELLVQVKNEVVRDLNTTIEHLAKKKWIFSGKIKKLIYFISEDLQIIGITYGMLVQVYGCLEQTNRAVIEMKSYINELHSFFLKEVMNTGLTAVELVHDNFDYNKNNLDFWFNLQQEMKPMLQKLSLLYMNEPGIALQGGKYVQ